MLSKGTIRLQKEYKQLAKSFEEQVANKKVVDNFVTCSDD